MSYRWCMGAFAVALGVGLAGATSSVRSQVIDMGKYPNIAGGGVEARCTSGRRGGRSRR
jgi:hypothetical protein